MDTSTQNVFQSTLLIGNYFRAVKKQFEFNFSWELFIVQSMLTSRPSLDTFRLKLLFLFSLYTNEIYCFSWSVWCKVLLIYQTGRLLCGKGGQFELACLFWPVFCNMRGRLNQVDHDLICKICQGIIQKLRTLKTTTLTPTTLTHVSSLLIIFTHSLFTDVLNFLCSLLQMMKEIGA